MVAQCVPPAGEALRDDPHGGGSTQKPQAKHEKKARSEDTSCGRKEPHDTDTPPDWGSSSDDVVPLHNWPCGDSGRPSDRGDSPGHLAQRPSEQKGAAAPRTTTRLTYHRRGACPLGSQPAVARSTTSTRAYGKKPRRARSLEKLTGGAHSTRGTFCPPRKFWSVNALGTDRLPRKRPTQQLLRGTRCELFKGLLAFFVQPMYWATSPEILVSFELTDTPTGNSGDSWSLNSLFIQPMAIQSLLNEAGGNCMFLAWHPKLFFELPR